MDAVIKALRTAPFQMNCLDTVYFGGGTPSLLGGRRIAKILESARSRFHIQPNAEITVECNPHSALAEELAVMRQAGVNRLSFGMQSADDAQLKLLGRLHTSRDVASAVESAHKCGFEHISLDMMLATPRQTTADINTAAQLCKQLGAEHVSAYLLKIEDDTPFARTNIAESCPDEDEQAALYRHAVAALAANGYEQYEISNFASGGKVARHNLSYWDCAEYLGIGPSAHSFINGRRRFFPRDLSAFLAADNVYTSMQDDGTGGDAEEYIMLRARLTQGIRWATLAERYPSYNATLLRERALPLVKHGLIHMDDGGFHLTVDGFLLSNAVICALIE